LVGKTAYFFFAVFFAAFFAGAFLAAFLAAFLVAICLFSLFDGLHRFCNRYIAVEECIESPSIDVKKKTTEEWKNKQQFFLVEFQFERAFTKIFALKIIFEARESCRMTKNDARNASCTLSQCSISLNMHSSFSGSNAPLFLSRSGSLPLAFTHSRCSHR